jgi:hypothetical protein
MIGGVKIHNKQIQFVQQAAPDFACGSPLI